MLSTRPFSIRVSPQGPGPSGVRSDFAEVPEIVFPSGFAGQMEHLGIFHLDPDNRWTPGDLTNAAGWLPQWNTELVPQDGATLPPGLHYEPATAVLSYDGSEPTAATRTVTVKLRRVGTSSESQPFKIRILQPTVVWGTGATSDSQIAAYYPSVPKYDPADGGVSGFNGACRAHLQTTATYAQPNVLFIMPGSYQGVDDVDGSGINNGDILLRDNLKYVYVIGVPTGRPTFTGNAIARNISFQSSRHSYLKNLEFVDFNVLERSYTNTEEDLADKNTFHTQILTRDSTTSNNWTGSDAREGDASPWAWVKSRVSTWMWNLQAIAAGGLDTTHLMYVEGRANSALFINNCRLYGGRGNNLCKSTRWLKKLRNSFLTTFLDPTDPSAGTQRSRELVDWVGCGVGVIYNNHLFSGYTAADGGTQHGLLRKRQRRDWWGSDTPAYPDQGFSPPSTSLIDGGYSSPPGFGPGPDVFVNPSYWAAVTSKPLGDPTNPYTFPYYVAYNTFQWHEEGAGRRPWFRDDGTYPSQAVRQFATSDILGTAPEGWVERSANFFANNTLIGWQQSDAADPQRYLNLDDSPYINSDPATIPAHPATFNTTLNKWVNGPGPWIYPAPARQLHYHEGTVVPWNSSSSFVPLPAWFLI